MPDDAVKTSQRIGEVFIEDQESRFVLERRFVAVFSEDNSTPNVENILYIKMNNSGVTITNFLNGQEGQMITILGDGNTTISDGGRIFTNTGGNKLLAVNRVYRFTLFRDINTGQLNWYEDN